VRWCGGRGPLNSKHWEQTAELGHLWWPECWGVVAFSEAPRRMHGASCVDAPCSGSSDSWCTSLSQDDGFAFLAHADPPCVVESRLWAAEHLGHGLAAHGPLSSEETQGGEDIDPRRLHQDRHALVLPTQPDTDQSPPKPLRCSLRAPDSARGTASSSHAGSPCPAMPPSLAEQIAVGSADLLPVQHGLGAVLERVLLGGCCPHGRGGGRPALVRTPRAGSRGTGELRGTLPRCRPPRGGWHRVSRARQQAVCLPF